MNAFEIKIAPEIEYIPLPLSSIRTFAGMYFKDYKTVEKIVLATEEALNNIISFIKSGRMDTIDITVNAEAGEFTVSVLDKGIPGNYEQTLKGEDRLGLTLMKSAVDEAYVENLGMGGRLQKLVKYYCNIPDVKKEDDANASKPIENAELTIRSPRKDEMLKICHAFYNEYGLTYVNDIVYYPERYYAAVAKDQIHTSVAIDQWGGLAGHMGVKKWDIVPGVWEGGMAIVNKNYRNMGVFSKLMRRTYDYVHDDAKGKLFIGCAVTTHPYTQKLRLKYGSLPCAFMLNAVPAEFAQSTFKEASKPTAEAVAGSLFDTSERTVYLPGELNDAAKYIYDGVKAERNILNEDGAPEYEITESKCAFNSRMRTGEINFVKVGEDFVTRLNSDFYELKQNGAETVTLYITMEKKGICSVYEKAKELGFFFTGILPATDQGDVLVMQKMLLHVVDYDSIVTIEPFTGLLDIVKSFDPDNK